MSSWPVEGESRSVPSRGAHDADIVRTTLSNQRLVIPVQLDADNAPTELRGDHQRGPAAGEWIQDKISLVSKHSNEELRQLWWKACRVNRQVMLLGSAERLDHRIVEKAAVADEQSDRPIGRRTPSPMSPAGTAE